MPKFRTKPVIKEAMRYTNEGNNFFEICEFVKEGMRAIAKDSFNNDAITIKTLEGDMLALVGDWIIKGVRGEFYPCKPDIFEKTYEPVE